MNEDWFVWVYLEGAYRVSEDRGSDSVSVGRARHAVLTRCAAPWLLFALELVVGGQLRVLTVCGGLSAGSTGC